MVIVVEKLPANAGDIRGRFNSWVRKIPLEKGRATHSSILAWKILWTKGPGGLHLQGCKKIGYNLVTKPPPNLGRI